MHGKTGRLVHTHVVVLVLQDRYPWSLHLAIGTFSGSCDAVGVGVGVGAAQSSGWRCKQESARGDEKKRDDRHSMICYYRHLPRKPRLDMMVTNIHTTGYYVVRRQQEKMRGCYAGQLAVCCRPPTTTRPWSVWLSGCGTARPTHPLPFFLLDRFFFFGQLLTWYGTQRIER